MGTSSSRRAPRGGGWTRAKGTASRFTSGTASASDVVSAYVGALGGSSKASRGGGGGGGGGRTQGAFPSAKKTARSLGSFLGGVASQGLDQTLRDLGLGDLVGRSASEVVSGIVDSLAGPGATLDEAIARVALIEVMGQLYDEDTAYGRLVDSWESGIDRDRCVELLELFLVESIYQKMLSDLADRIEEHSNSVAMTRARELELRDYIKEMVRFDLGQSDPLRVDWQGQEGDELIARNLEAALAQLEE